MTTFTTRDVSMAVVAAPRDDVWALVSDPATLAELTPLIDSIESSGELWCWQLTGVSALGVSITPSFTERMTLDAPSSIEYEHAPPDGSRELAGAHGTYRLVELGPDSTRLEIDITLCADLPLPRFSRRAVEKVMATMMRRTGDAFAERLYERLGIDGADVVEHQTASAR
ncbi:MAG: SRPBCC family protein [Ilumatobacter sp.]|nr:SRPBCC family protein [Ilumatobacter sp.]